MTRSPSGSRGKRSARNRTIIISAVALVAASLSVAALATNAVAGAPAQPAGAVRHSCTSTTGDTYVSCAWLTTLPGNVGQSAPTTATLSGTRVVLIGDTRGHRDALNLSTGAPVSGWNDVATGAERIDAPISTDGGNRVYMGLSTTKGRHELGSYTAAGKTVWGANTCAEPHCQQSPGLTLLPGNAYTGGPQQYVYGMASTTGGRHWSYLTSDSTNTTAAAANLTGSGPMVVFANDQTPNKKVGAVSGGHIRVFTSGGMPICDANIGGGPAHPGAFSSSPAVGSFGGAPEIVVGTGSSGSNVNRMMFFNTACQLTHTSARLAGYTKNGPAIATINGTQRVIEEVEAPDSGGQNKNVVYVLSGTTGQVVQSKTLTGLVGSFAGRTCHGGTVGTAASSVTADVNGDGAQDIIAPAGDCGAIVLNGKNLSEMAQVGNGCNDQNTPLVTSASGSVGITVAGYRAKAGGGAEGCVFHYVARGGLMGSAATSWPQFHHDANLSGSSSYDYATHGMVVTGQSLLPGHYIYSTSGAYKAGTSASTGRLEVIRTRDGAVVWNNGHSSKGARMLVGDGNVVTKNTSGVSIWSTPRHAETRALHVVMQENGHLALWVHSGNEWATDTILWES